jgi:hypothetical protein
VDYRFTMSILRGTLTLDFTPDGAIEDVMSEVTAGGTTLTPDSCASADPIDNTLCEIAEDYGSTDAYTPIAPPLAHEVSAGGRAGTLFVGKSGGSIELDWGTSCSSADTAYAVYEGTVGSWYSHAGVAGLCPNGGATSAIFAPMAGDRYYLVVPTAGSSEGSYGEDSGSNERPVGTSTCAPNQVLGNCY